MTYETPKTKKIPYDQETGRFPTWETHFDDLPLECEGDCVEMAREEYTAKIYMGAPPMHYPVWRDGKVEYEFDERYRELYEGAKKADEIGELERYLEETDYVVIKMYEASIEGQDLVPFKEKYADVLEKRREAREKVNAYKEGL